MNDTTRALAGFAADVRYDRLERELVDKFKKHLLDAIGCGLHGAIAALGADRQSIYPGAAGETGVDPVAAAISGVRPQTWPWAWA